MTETRYTIETRERTPQSGAIPEIKMRAARLLLTFGLLLVALGGFARNNAGEYGGAEHRSLKRSGDRCLQRLQIPDAGFDHEVRDSGEPA